jgi:hypothetical protein
VDEQLDVDVGDVLVEVLGAGEVGQAQDAVDLTGLLV